jgi:site-specific recombinase XerD
LGLSGGANGHSSLLSQTRRRDRLLCSHHGFSMDVRAQNTNPGSIINHPTLKNAVNIIVATAAIPGYAIRHDRNSVVISGEKLGEVLEQLYSSGFRRVEVLIEVAGRQILTDATIYNKRDGRRNRTYFMLYPLKPGQAVLRMLLNEHRRGAAPRAKRPLPVLIHRISVSLKPK